MDLDGRQGQGHTSCLNGIDVFAPGDQILSSYSGAGFNDTKYTQGTGNYFYPISGTSMASPQVSGVIACLASGNPRFTQADAFGYLDSSSVYDDMTFDVGGGGLADNTSQIGSPNKYLICKNPRQDVGYISKWTDLRSDRSGNQVFPRQKVLHGPRLKPLPQTYTFTVTASNTSNYTFSGDATGDDPNISCLVGDTLVFNLSTGVINHPFWIKTARTTGTGSGVFTGTLSPSNGRTTGTITWDTTGVSPGIYYYVCQFHINMSGQITITAA